MRTEYDQQADDFLKLTGATIEVAHHSTGKHFADDKNNTRDIWSVRLTRGSRSYTFTYGSSIVDRAKWDGEPYPASDWDAPYNHGKPVKYVPMPKPHALHQLTAEALAKVQARKRSMEKDYQPAGTGHRPTAYDILACLNGYEPADNVDDFAQEFGIDKPSVALETFEKVREEYANLRMLFNDQELEALNDIN